MRDSRRSSFPRNIGPCSARTKNDGSDSFPYLLTGMSVCDCRNQRGSRVPVIHRTSTEHARPLCAAMQTGGNVPQSYNHSHSFDKTAHSAHPEYYRKYRPRLITLRNFPEANVPSCALYNSDARPQKKKGVLNLFSVRHDSKTEKKNKGKLLVSCAPATIERSRMFPLFPVQARGTCHPSNHEDLNYAKLPVRHTNN